MNVCNYEPCFLEGGLLGVGYQCWVSVLKSRVMEIVVNVSSEFSCRCKPELMRNFDAT